MNRTSILASILIFPFLAILLPLLLICQIDNIYYSPNIALSFIVIIYAALRLTVFSCKGAKRIIDLAFWLFVYVFLGLASLTQLMTNHFPWVDSYSEYEIFQAYLVILTGLASYDLGQILSRKKANKQISKEILLKKNEEIGIFTLTVRKFYLLSILSTIFVFFVGFFKLHGQFFISRGDFTGKFSNTTDLLVFSSIFRTPAFVALIIGLVLLIDGKRVVPKSRAFFYPTLFWVFILNILANNPIANARFWFGTVLLAIGFVIFRWGRISFSIWVNSFVIILIVVFPYSDLFRHSLDSQIVTVETYKQLSQNGDYDAFQQIVNTIRYTNHFGYAYGTQFLGALLFFVPRSVWLTKPPGTGALIADGIGYKYNNLSAPFWSECFVNFSFIGIIVLFFLYGMFIEKIQDTYINRKRNRLNISLLNIFVPFFAAYQFYFLRGDLLNAVANLTCFIVFSLLGSRLNKEYLVKQKAHKKLIKASLKLDEELTSIDKKSETINKKQRETQEKEKELMHV
ncbi:O-antigen polymerase [Priestia megaterium]|uniref:O-antigen polymerase n=1 Tax=Priestia megaterium TaxID=1404 RepID=UPI00101BB3E9|nr:O-antigen polymerase [Priestia megaterium]